MFQATEMGWEQALGDREPLDPALGAGPPTGEEQQVPRLPQRYPVARTYPSSLPNPQPDNWTEVGENQAPPR